METTVTQALTRWGIDFANSQIGFKVKYLLFSNVRGSFKQFDATIYTTGEDFTGVEINTWINAASINTGNEKRDAHLMSADFFDVERFKEIVFTARTLVAGEKDGQYELYGQLTMKGIKRPIKLLVEFGGIIRDPWGTVKALFSVEGKINRKDWGLNWNTVLETGGVLVSEEVWINCDMQLTKQSPDPV